MNRSTEVRGRGRCRGPAVVDHLRCAGVGGNTDLLQQPVRRQRLGYESGSVLLQRFPAVEHGVTGILLAGIKIDNLYTGLDHFGRVKDVRWQDVSAGDGRLSRTVWLRQGLEPDLAKESQRHRESHDWLYGHPPSICFCSNTQRASFQVSAISQPISCILRMVSCSPGRSASWSRIRSEHCAAN